MARSGLTLDSAVAISGELAHRDLGDEAIVLHLETGEYYGLDEVGARIWSLLAEDGCLRSVHRAIVSEYDVRNEVAERDLLRLVGDLEESGLVELR